MRTRSATLALGMTAMIAAATWGHAQVPPGRSEATQQATVETAAIELTPPDRYQVPLVLEAGRRVALMATADGIVRQVMAPIGATVRENQEVAQLDRAEAAARLKIAEAEVKQAQAEHDAIKGATGKSRSDLAIVQARLEASKARAELAQLEVERCTLRAPFPGRVVAVPVSTGQYVAKGSVVAELADASNLNVLVPVDRTAVKANGTIALVVEGRPVTGKVQALLPLAETYANLRELATPWAGAWVVIANPKGELEPGERVRSPWSPDAPIAVVASRAIALVGAKEPEAGRPVVRVVRNGVVADVAVRVLGESGPERTQVSGAFRPTDAVIVESSIPLAAGTVIRFGGHDGNGTIADIAPAVDRPRVAPIGAPGTAAPARPAPSRTTTKKAATPPSRPGTVPF
jgi:membrane fusion protein (multidrug efflux system)